MPAGGVAARRPPPFRSPLRESTPSARERQHANHVSSPKSLPRLPRCVFRRCRPPHSRARISAPPTMWFRVWASSAQGGLPATQTRELCGLLRGGSLLFPSAELATSRLGARALPRCARLLSSDGTVARTPLQGIEVPRCFPPYLSSLAQLLHDRPARASLRRAAQRWYMLSHHASAYNQRRSSCVTLASAFCVFSLFHRLPFEVCVGAFPVLLLVKNVTRHVSSSNETVHCRITT